ncbi:kazrin isoform X3 [Ischnura elegans]|uniref:kazrin isoform X3 n=1 Tax=Ischnura elegans TaxID=197161 RepID=UPI001ED86D9F|nr:kazrin isoform X3 [Ischnura elegans]
MVEEALRTRTPLFPPPSPMRRLLVDAQAKFRRMVEENKGIPSRIDSEMQGIIGNSHTAGSSTTASPSLPALPKRPTTAPPPIPNASVPGSPASGPGPPPPINNVNSMSTVISSVNASTHDDSHHLPPSSASMSSPMHKGVMDKVAKDAEENSLPPNADGNSQGIPTSSTAGSLSPAASSTATNETKDMNAAEDASKTSESDPKNFNDLEQGAGVVEKDTLGPKSPNLTKLGESSFNRSWRRGDPRVKDGMDYYGDPRRMDRRRDEGENRCCRRAREENERLRREVVTLRKLLGTEDEEEEGAVGGDVRAISDVGADGEDGTMAPRHRRRLQVMELELRHAKEAVAALKADRKRLKAEKFDLLNQMKQLYGTLEDKEKELRDFIRNYEQRMRENEASLQQLWSEREERERERWRLLRHAKDQTERGITLAAQLSAREAQARDLHQQLQECKRQLVTAQGTCGCGASSDQECGNGSMHNCRLNGSGLIGGLGGGVTPTSGQPQTPTGSGSVLGVTISGERGSSADSGVRGSSDRESVATSAGGGNLSDSTTEEIYLHLGTPTITVEGSNMDMDSISVMSSIAPASHIYQTATTPKDSPSALSPLNANSVFTRSVEQLIGTPSEYEIRRNKISVAPSTGMGTIRLGSGGTRSRGGGGTWGSISRVFARNRHRKLASPSQEDVNDPSSCCRSWSPLTEEGYAEKLRLLREASSIPMERWRAPTVLAWLEIALGMPQYGPRCSENVKSGKVLLELSDVELEAGLGITHPLHRKKLRLAIEEHRRPALVRFPAIATLTHTWVSSEWLPDIGLAQFSESFATNMVDARMLDHLSKKELEKYLGVTRKFHQASIVHGIHLLRMMKYDRQALAVRRRQCENIDADPLVWTNQRIIRWARNIDLTEYADNLKDSGVHGALVVLEPSFNGDTMANALGIPQSKNIIRRHLTAELEALVLPARAAFEHFVRSSKVELGAKLSSGGSLGRSFSRSNENQCPPPLPQRESFGLRLGLGGGKGEMMAMEGEGGGFRVGDHKDYEVIREKDKDRRRASLRAYSLLNLKKGSLSKALGLKAKQDIHHVNSRNYDIGEATSSSVYTGKRGSLVLASPSPETAPSSSSSLSLVSPLPPPLPPQNPSSSSSSFTSTATSSSQRLQRLHHHHHRRVKSIGDIETVTTVTPV